MILVSLIIQRQNNGTRAIFRLKCDRSTDHLKGTEFRQEFRFDYDILKIKRLDFDVISVSEEERNEPIMFFGRNICDLICVLARKPKFRGRHSD